MFGRFASDQDKAMLLRFAQLADVMTAREAAVEARKITDPNNNELRVSREAAIKKEKFADNYESWTIDILGAMNPTSMAKATRQMEVLFETGYMSGMTANQAEEQAKKLLTIPVHQYLNSKHMNYVIIKIKQFYNTEYKYD